MEVEKREHARAGNICTVCMYMEQKLKKKKKKKPTKVSAIHGQWVTKTLQVHTEELASICMIRTYIYEVYPYIGLFHVPLQLCTKWHISAP